MKSSIYSVREEAMSKNKEKAGAGRTIVILLVVLLLLLTRPHLLFNLMQEINSIVGIYFCRPNADG